MTLRRRSHSVFSQHNGPVSRSVTNWPKLQCYANLRLNNKKLAQKHQRLTCCKMLLRDRGQTQPKSATMFTSSSKLWPFRRRPANWAYMATHQSDEVTRARANQGECYVALAGGVFVGTIIFKPADRTDGCPWLDRGLSSSGAENLHKRLTI